MLKQAWRSYLASLHPRYLRKAYENGAIFQLLYWFVIYPLIMNVVSDNLEFYDLMALMFMRMIPFMIMEWSNINSKYLMPKVMYLSPMRENERKEYINNVLFIKIGMTVFLGMCIEVIWGILTGFHIGKVLIAGVLNLSIGVASYISLEAFGKTDRKIYAIVKDKAEKKSHWLNILVIISVIITMFFVAIIEVGAEEGLAVFCKWFIVIITVGLLLLDILIARKEYQATVALASEYELAFKVEGKVEPKHVKFDMFEKKSY